MDIFRQYKHIFGFILFLAVVSLLVVRFTEVAGFVQLIMAALMPFIIGGAIAFILNIIVVRYEKLLPEPKTEFQRSAKRTGCIVAAIVTIFLAISFVGRLAIPQLVHSLTIIVYSIPAIYAEASTRINDLITMFPYLAPLLKSADPNQLGLTKDLATWGTEGGRYLVQTMSSAMEWMFNLVIGFIFAIYVLLDKDVLRRQFSMLFRAYGKRERVDKFYYVLTVAYDTFSGFFIGQFLDALILGIMVGIGLAIFGVSYALTIACVVGLTALIPLVGAYIGGFMGVLMLLAVSPMETVIFLIVLVVMQQIEGNFVYPKIVGGNIGLPGIWVFLAITVGGTLYGVVGMLLSVPLAATIYKLVKNDVHKRLVTGRTE